MLEGGRLRINAYLKKLHWSQIDLARNAGVSSGTVKRAMTGATISARSAQNIISALDTAMTKQASVQPEDVTGLHVARSTRKHTRRRKTEESPPETS